VFAIFIRRSPKSHPSLTLLLLHETEGEPFQTPIKKTQGDGKPPATISIDGVETPSVGTEASSLDPPSSTKRTLGFSQKKKKPTPSKEASSSASVNSSATKEKPNDRIYLTVVPGHEDFAGIAFHFMPHPDKSNNASPFSTYHVTKMMKEDCLTFEDVEFQPRSFDLVVNGTAPMYTNPKDGRQYNGRLYIANGIINPPKEGVELIADAIVKDLREWHRDDNRSGDLVEKPHDWYREVECWSDIMTVNDAYQNLKWLAKPVLRKHNQGWIKEDEDSWAKHNMDIITTYFKKGTLSKNICVALGLPKEWATPESQEL